MFKRAELTNLEKNELKECCENFGKCFTVYFSETITRKMHDLIFYVPQFVNRWNMVGMLSEQEGESLHNSVNQELRQLYCVRNPCQKLKLVLRRQELWSKS